MTTTHKFDQCSPTSGSVVIILMVLASRNTDGSHPGTVLPSARAAAANVIDRTNESIARLAIRHFFISVNLPARYIRHSTADRSLRAMSWLGGLARSAGPSFFRLESQFRPDCRRLTRALSMASPDGGEAS